MVIVLLPAYNEADGIGLLLDRIENVLGDLPHYTVVVDDGSLDGTGGIVNAAAQRWPILLLQHPTNRGLGRAMQTGLEYVCTRWMPEDMVVTMDADNTHDPALIIEMLRAVDAGADVVIASRFVGQAGQVGVPWYRRLLSGGARTVFQWLFPINVDDYTSGYRLYRIRLLQKAMTVYTPLIEATGFVVMVEILLKLSRLNPVVSQVPLLLRYDLKGSQSKMRLVKTLVEYGKILIRLQLHKPALPS